LAVWPAFKIRNLLDSMYKGSGWLPVVLGDRRRSGRPPDRVRDKQAMPALLIMDGRQRLTSLYGVMTSSKIVRKHYADARIRIAFCFTLGEASHRVDQPVTLSTKRCGDRRCRSSFQIAGVSSGGLQPPRRARETHAS
jgi:hypothetical protein